MKCLDLRNIWECVSGSRVSHLRKDRRTAKSDSSGSTGVLHSSLRRGITFVIVCRSDDIRVSEGTQDASEKIRLTTRQGATWGLLSMHEGIA